MWYNSTPPRCENKCKINEVVHRDRDPFFDLLKAFAIFLVIVQHMIAACGYDLEMMNTPVGKCICMFNMPLFMGIVGYFFNKSLSRSFHDFFISKWKTWLRPALIFSLLLISWRLYAGVLPFPNIWKKVLVYFLFDFLGCYWFIPVAFLCCLILKISYKLYPNIVFSCLLSWFILVIFPFCNFYPLLEYLKAMYPFSCIGLLCHNKGWISKINRRPLSAGLCSLIFFVLLFLWFDKSKFFYDFTIVSGEEFVINYMALLIASISGSILSIIFINYLTKLNFIGKRYLLWCGASTFSIYMLQQLFVQWFYLMHLNVLGPFEIMGISILVFVLCTMLIMFLDQFKFTKVYLLGKKE